MTDADVKSSWCIWMSSSQQHLKLSNSDVDVRRYLLSVLFIIDSTHTLSLECIKLVNDDLHSEFRLLYCCSLITLQLMLRNYVVGITF